MSESLPRPLRLVAALTFLLTAGLANGAFAQGDVPSRVEILLGDAYADYDMLELDGARAKLQEAIDLSEQYAVRTPGSAGAYIMMGVVQSVITGNSSVALDYFIDGLTIDPLAEIHPFYATPSLVELMEEARSYVPDEPLPPPGPAPPPPGPYPPTPPRPTGQVLLHTPVVEGIAGRSLLVAAQVPAGVPAARVVVNFRPFGEPNFFAIDLGIQSDGISYVGEIPDQATRGVISVDYFLSVFDRGGNMLGSAGTPAAPYTIILLSGGDGPDARRADRDRQRRQRDRDRRDRDFDRDRANTADEIFHLSLGAGTGIGLATAEPNVYHDDIELNPGLAPTPIHIGVEAGFAPGRGSLHVVPFLRLQLVALDTGLDPLPLFGVKARYFFKDTLPLRVYAEGGLGYGDVSHLVLLQQIEPAGTYDTTNEGPFHMGAGFGLVYMFGETVGLQTDLYAMFLVDRISLHLDLTAGLYFGF